MKYLQKIHSMERENQYVCKKFPLRVNKRMRVSMLKDIYFTFSLISILHENVLDHFFFFGHNRFYPPATGGGVVY